MPDAEWVSAPLVAVLAFGAGFLFATFLFLWGRDNTIVPSRAAEAIHE